MSSKITIHAAADEILALMDRLRELSGPLMSKSVVSDSRLAGSVLLESLQSKVRWLEQGQAERRTGVASVTVDPASVHPESQNDQGSGPSKSDGL